MIQRFIKDRDKFVMNVECMVPNTAYTIHSFFRNHEVVSFSAFL